MEEKIGAGQLSERQGQLLVVLARNTILEKLTHFQPAGKEAGRDAYRQEPIFMEKRGVFVTLHRAGQLRGCIGSLVGTTPIFQGVIDNAINAAFKDLRFQPVTAVEFETIEVEVSILSELQPLPYENVDDLIASLRPGIDGVVIRKGGASATFLPQVWKQLPGVDGFLSHLCLKAGLSADEWQQGELEVLTYQVQSFSEVRQASTLNC